VQCEQPLELGLDAVLLQARVDAQLVELSCSTDSMVMISCSPALLVTVQVPAPSVSSSRSEHGGVIQFSGL
jgi:hypothetical protein